MENGIGNTLELASLRLERACLKAKVEHLEELLANAACAILSNANYVEYDGLLREIEKELGVGDGE